MPPPEKRKRPPRRDVYSVPEGIVVLDDHVALVKDDAELDTVVRSAVALRSVLQLAPRSHSATRLRRWQISPACRRRYSSQYAPDAP
jgi:hypothetical protein